MCQIGLGIAKALARVGYFYGKLDQYTQQNVASVLFQLPGRISYPRRSLCDLKTLFWVQKSLLFGSPRAGTSRVVNQLSSSLVGPACLAAGAAPNQASRCGGAIASSAVQPRHQPRDRQPSLLHSQLAGDDLAERQPSLTVAGPSISAPFH